MCSFPPRPDPANFSGKEEYLQVLEAWQALCLQIANNNHVDRPGDGRPPNGRSQQNDQPSKNGGRSYQTRLSRLLGLREQPSLPNRQFCLFSNQD